MTQHCIAQDLNIQQHNCVKQKPNFLRYVAGVILPPQLMSHPSRLLWMSFLTHSLCLSTICTITAQT